LPAAVTSADLAAFFDCSLPSRWAQSGSWKLFGSAVGVAFAFFAGDFLGVGGEVVAALQWGDRPSRWA
jgi:hypothetical protein